MRGAEYKLHVDFRLRPGSAPNPRAVWGSTVCNTYEWENFTYSIDVYIETSLDQKKKNKKKKEKNKGKKSTLSLQMPGGMYEIRLYL